jgi:hypothetical protein
MFYYVCARCNHITKQKVEMKRHLEKVKKCCIRDKENKLSDFELFNKSLEVANAMTLPFSPTAL